MSWRVTPVISAPSRPEPNLNITRVINDMPGSTFVEKYP